MKLAYALASNSLFLVVSAIDQKRIKRNLRHLESAKNKNEESSVSSSSMRSTA